jgi:tRNA (mo5U34)-methyltransferase
MIPDFDQFLIDAAPFADELYALAQEALAGQDIKVEALQKLLDQLPEVEPTRIALDRDCVTIGRASDLTDVQRSDLETVLQGLKPWRKGPFDLFGIRIDSEWDSSLKWRRVMPHLAPLTGRRILDVGSSNGYYLYRMADAQPRLILGIEPYRLYYFQFLVLQQFIDPPGLYNLPLKLEALPAMPQWFDTIFCMGILYHRRSPLDTLSQLSGLLAKGGQLVLETLIIRGDGSQALFPRQRYACMRNVYFLPTVECLENWLARCGFTDIRCVDITATTVREQRKTQWIDSDSLDRFLDPKDSGLTVEGYPAPVRAVVVATKPG